MDGYMVSHESPSVAINAKEFFAGNGEVGKQAILDFMNANGDMLAQKGNYLGGWHDPESGKVFLDVSTNVSTKQQAVDLGRQNNQISIYDVKGGSTINTGGTGGLDNGT
jgi:hypothetical protein